jgi:hypothetical protein
MGEFLTRFTECSLFTFSVKDIETHKIIMNNKACAEVWGLADVGLQGMTSADCLDQVPNFKEKDTVLKAFEEEENKAIHANNTQSKLITILDYEGFVRVRQHATIPVMNSQNRTVAIAAICHNLTVYTPLLELFELYQYYYSKLKTVEHLSKYLKLDHYFHTKLTFGELASLLALVQDPRRKVAAQRLTEFRKKSISPATVSGYVDSMKDKLKSHADFYILLSHLRVQHQWTTKLDIC